MASWGPTPESCLEPCRRQLPGLGPALLESEGTFGHGEENRNRSPVLTNRKRNLNSVDTLFQSSSGPALILPSPLLWKKKKKSEKFRTDRAPGPA